MIEIFTLSCNDNFTPFVNLCMKRLFAVAIAAIAFAACTKQAEDDFQKDILGTWVLERSVSWEPPAFTPPASLKKFILNADGTYRMERNDTLTNAGVFSLEHKEDCSGKKQHFFCANGFISHTLSLENGKLILATSNCLVDGGVSIYRRKVE